jgi:uncharacterized protein YjbI with pentapeptide repeats
LNGVDVFAADIRNAYLQAPSSQKDYVRGANLTRKNIRKVAPIRRALYGKQPAGEDLRKPTLVHARHLDFTPWFRHPDVWMVTC